MQKIYTDVFWNQIINDDILNWIKKEENESVDLILSDPPYNINYTNNRRVKTRDKIHGVDGIMNDKDNLEMIEKAYAEYFRILKEWKHIYIFTRWDVAQDHIDLLKKAWFIVKNNLIWDKWNMSMWDLWGDFGWQYENILFAIKPYSKWKKKWKADKLNPIWNRTRHSNIIKYKRVVWKKQIHSHQKPMWLLKFLIQKSSKTGDIVYDWFAWSNSLGISAASLWRKYKTLELNPEVFEIAINNTENYLNYLKKNLDKVENHIYIENLNLLLITKSFLSKITNEDKKSYFLLKGKKKILIQELFDLIQTTNPINYNWKEIYLINIEEN